MAPRLVEAHIEAARRLRVIIAQAVERIWRSLPSHDRANVDQWFSSVLPLIAAGQTWSVLLTDAYLARSLRREPLGLDADELTGAAVRNGTPPEVVYKRPFVQLWSGLGEGKGWDDAFDAALARAASTAQMDIALSQRAAMDAVGEADENIFGFRRAIDSDPCDYCRMIDGAYVKRASAMPLHNHCGCSLEPLTKPHPRAAFLPSGVAVHEHGELGAVLTSSEHDFTTEAQALGH